jgi:hypothetical protein
MDDKTVLKIIIIILLSISKIFVLIALAKSKMKFIYADRDVASASPTCAPLKSELVR